MVNLSDFSSFFIANWKLNGNIDFIKDYFSKLQLNSKNGVVICAPNIYLNLLQKNNKNLFSGAQDVSKYHEGAFTGETSVNMLNDLGVDFCLVGHSERRQYFHENNREVLSKSNNLIEKKIIPVICIGETLEDRQKKITKNVLSKQLEECVPSNSNFQNALIAYEPIWAIGTGLTPKLDEIDEVHDFIRNFDKKFKNFKILYGGSVKASNSIDIVSLNNVNGCLIGGSSLKIDEFNKIIE